MGWPYVSAPLPGESLPKVQRIPCAAWLGHALRYATEMSAKVGADAEGGQSTTSCTIRFLPAALAAYMRASACDKAASTFEETAR